MCDGGRRRRGSGVRRRREVDVGRSLTADGDDGGSEEERRRNGVVVGENLVAAKMGQKKWVEKMEETVQF